MTTLVYHSYNWYTRSLREWMLTAPLSINIKVSCRTSQVYPEGYVHLIITYSLKSLKIWFIVVTKVAKVIIFFSVIIILLQCRCLSLPYIAGCLSAFPCQWQDLCRPLIIIWVMIQWGTIIIITRLIGIINRRWCTTEIKCRINTWPGPIQHIWLGDLWQLDSWRHPLSRRGRSIRVGRILSL